MLRLLYVKFERTCPYPGCHVLSGAVEVAPQAGPREVLIRFTTGDGVWQTAAATPAGTTAGGEAWTFTQGLLYRGVPVTLHTQYLVGGQVYTEDQAGASYAVGWSADVTELRLPALPLVLDTASWRGGAAFGGRIVVQNRAYHKQLTVVYSTDGWQSETTGAAHYAGALPHSDGQLEYWDFELPVDRAAAVQFVIRATMGSATSWDTNFGRRYTLGR